MKAASRMFLIRKSREVRDTKCMICMSILNRGLAVKVFS